MAISKIQYDDKVAINIDSTIPDINKCNASDLNEIKSVVNNNADEIPSNDNLVNVGSSVDTDYKTNILTTTNLFTGQLYNGIIGQNGVYEYGPARITMTNKSLSNTLFIKKGTYTLSIDGLDFCTALTKDTNGNRIDNFADSWKPLPFTFTTTQDAYLYFSARKSDSSNINPNDYKPVLVEGNTAPSTYIPFINNTINVNNEKYTDTINVGTEINNKNKVNILYSKNLFDKDNAVVLNLYFDDNDVLQASPYNKLIYIPCRPNTTYTLQKEASPTTRQIGYTTEYPAVNVQVYDKVVIATNGTTGTITTGANAKYLVCRFYQTSQDTSLTIEQMLATIQIEYGSEASSYEPYIVPSINVDGEEIYNNNLMNYSTNEVIVGKWVDGRNIYRKVVSGTTTSTENTWGTLTTINNLDIITKIDFNVVVADNEKYTNNMHNINFYNDGTDLKFRPTTAYWINRPITAIVEYTKTTG